MPLPTTVPLLPPVRATPASGNVLSRGPPRPRGPVRPAREIAPSGYGRAVAAIQQLQAHRERAGARVSEPQRITANHSGSALPGRGQHKVTPALCPRAWRRPARLSLSVRWGYALCYAAYYDSRIAVLAEAWLVDGARFPALCGVLYTKWCVSIAEGPGDMDGRTDRWLAGPAGRMGPCGYLVTIIAPARWFR